MNCDTLEAAAARLGEELVKARRSRKLLQRSLAAKVGMSRMTVANLEAGRGTVAALVLVLDALAHRFAEQPADVELGPWLAHTRKTLGLSQERLSIQAGVSRPAIIRIERGEGTIATMIAAMVMLSLSPSLKGVAVEATLPVPTARLFHGDCCDHMRHFAEENVFFDSIVTDPPYHLSSISRRFGRKQAAPLGREPGSNNPYRTIATGFMGQEWDGTGIAFDPETWRAAYDVLKPGGYLVAFGGPRTFHRLTVAVEDAGFEIRDTIMWIFGSGLPKSLNLQGRHAGRGTALKPAHEPILIARKPLSKASVADNVVQFGTGALNIEACRVPSLDDIEIGRTGRGLGSSHALMGAGLPSTAGERTTHNRGRWPANIIHDGSPAVLAGFPDTGRSRGGVGNNTVGKTVYGRFNSANYDGDLGDGDEGSTARFFYCAKASKSDRGTGNNHPCVKPGDLMRYLVRLVTPAHGTVLDPFAGSGSTAVAALQEGYSFVGSEMMAEYVEIARRRIAKALPGKFDDQPGEGSLAAYRHAVRSAS